MLCISRKKDETVIIDDRICIKILAVQGDKVRIGIEAPKDVPIHRGEVWATIQQEKSESEKIED